MKLYNYFHIYAAGANWHVPLNEYLKSLKDSGLSDALEAFRVGIVGAKPQREAAKVILTATGIRHEVVAEADSGWEQVTQNKLYEFSLNHDGYVLYSHTKGAANNTSINASWRQYMIINNVDYWKKMVDLLPHFTAAGCHWLTPRIHPSIGKVPFFAGTFWWTSLEHVRSLGYPPMEDRWGAERWIGINYNEKPFTTYDVNPGWPSFDIYKNIKSTLMTYKPQPIMRTAQNSWDLRVMCRELRQYLIDSKATLLVEVGAYAGESSEIFAQEFPFMEIQCIDPWQQGYDPADVTSSADMGAVESDFTLRTLYLSNLKKLKGISEDFPQLEPFIVYIDGNHQYEAVKADIKFWLARLKPGGIIAGHDYWSDEFLKTTPHVAGVKRAIHELLGVPDRTYGDGSWYKKM